jgi:DNA-binding response OmpR family regulator
MTQIVLVEDNESYADGLSSVLVAEGFEVQVAGNAAAGFRCVRDLRPALVLLDLVLPGRSGLDLLRQLRGHGVNAPVVVLTAQRDEQDKIRALTVGADEYITKPVGVRELSARIGAVLRRAHADEQAGPSWVRVGDVEVHPPTRAVRQGGRPVDLTPREYDLLMALLRRRGRAVSRAELLAEVWRQEPAERMRVVDTHVLGLRQKVERDPRCPRLILTVHAAGYMMAR